MKSDFNRLARKLIKSKIHFTTTDSEPRFEIQGQRFATQELIQLDQEDKLTNSRVSEIITTKRLAAASKVAGPESLRTKAD
jgi:hypothetical protein